MLVLSTNEIRYCSVVKKTAEQIKTRSGLCYEGKLYLKGESFNKERGQDAIKKARQAFVEHKGQVLYLVIQEPNCFTLYAHDKRIELKEKAYSPQEIVAKIDLKKLVRAMRSAGGIEIKNRRYHFGIYNQCFVGSEAVFWLRKKLRISEILAVQLGQRLVDEKLIHHVFDEHPFRNDYLFYRFYEDEKVN